MEDPPPPRPRVDAGPPQPTPPEPPGTPRPLTAAARASARTSSSTSTLPRVPRAPAAAPAPAAAVAPAVAPARRRASSSSGAAPSRRLARRGIYRKELFLQANFRFLVADFANLDGAANDPDHVVDWDDVVLVEMASEAPLTCPVCLDAPPEAPQVTLCGHAFCFPCIARHAATNRRSDTGEPAKCPMCFAPTRLADLRGVRRRPVEAIRAADRSRGRGAGEGDAPGEKKNDEESVVKMSLVRRHRASSVPRRAEAYRAEAELAGEAAAWPRSVRARDGGACDRFAKYTLTGEEAAFAEEELATLEAKAARMAEEGGSENENQLPFVLLACDVVQNRARAWGERRAEREGREAPPIAPSRRDAVAAKAARAAERAAETRAPAPHRRCFEARGGRRREQSQSRAGVPHGRAVQAASAFSEEEEEDEDEDEDEDEVSKRGGGPLENLRG